VRSCLAIDTSSEACSVALALDDEIRQRHLHEPLRHAELLLPAIRDVLDEADLTLRKLDFIAFGRGPGSFTSLRIGIGVVQGLAWGADLPVVPVSSLAAVAQQVIGPALQKAAETEARFVLAVMDARMSEVFHCTFGVDGGGILTPEYQEAVSPPDDVRVSNPRATIGAGNGFQRYPELSRLGGILMDVKPDVLPHAAALIPLARQWLKSHEPLPAAEAQPVYIRNQVADKPSTT